MTREPSLNGLWESLPSGERTFRSGQLTDLTEAARRYLEHANAPGALFASEVRLRMHGEIKLGRRLPFTAEQVIHWGRGMIWNATVRMKAIPIRGFDRLVNGEGAMRWKLFGIVPVMRASGPDITRSAAGRVMAESVWLPSVLCGDEARWTAQDAFHPRASLTVQGEAGELALTIDDNGGLKTLTLPRWVPPGVQSSGMWTSAVLWRRRVGSVPTPFRLACELDTTSGQTGLSRTVSFSASRWMTRRTGKQPMRRPVRSARPTTP